MKTIDNLTQMLVLFISCPMWVLLCHSALCITLEHRIVCCVSGALGLDVNFVHDAVLDAIGCRQMLPGKPALAHRAPS